MDLKYTYELDLEIVDGEFQLQDNGEATTINAFFSDARYANQRGYWIQILSTTLWRYDQSRVTDDTISDIQEIANNISRELVAQGVYDKLNAEVKLEGMYVILYIQGHNDNKINFNRKFRI